VQLHKKVSSKLQWLEINLLIGTASDKSGFSGKPFIRLPATTGK
jgi:hypothetical protein